MILAVLLGVIAIIVGGVFYLMLLQPFQYINSAMYELVPESAGILDNLNTLFIWAPVFLILIPVFVYLIVKAMEERVRGEVYYP
ncbi:MAG: hypothetical protein ABC596_09050 [Candidatus Methanosuratincola petrocarbonis]